MSENDSSMVQSFNDDNCEINVESKVLSTSDCVKDNGKGKYKISKVLGNVETNTAIINKVNIPGGFTEIKGIKRDVVVTQAKLIGGQLFVEGYIINNISYVTPSQGYSKSCCMAHRNIWNDIDVKTPFSMGIDASDLDGKMHMNKCIKTECPYANNTMKNNRCDTGTMGSSLCEKLSYEKKVFNEIPYCELNSFEISELTINKMPQCDNCHDKCCDDYRKVYCSIVQKIVLKLELSILVEGYKKMHHSEYNTEFCNPERCQMNVDTEF
ncbi:hypothetical protein [Hathewaya limosa]|uniref:Uncharacterized protein n=1 Tax=Hathewaya limosa TaxID=1536 RepID=A0ABU0JX03_HATLI|nr:hypothetical protein [Hathewaya limosa]MDQ0480447.1 hypothetical protein [Hathewaya limosa]